jgi:hypothetical protein
MKTLSPYLAREFAQNFFLGPGAFSATYLIVEFFERINAFLYNKAAWPMIGTYFLNKFPGILFQVTLSSPSSWLFWGPRWQRKKSGGRAWPAGSATAS